jgi:hypothetical protein
MCAACVRILEIGLILRGDESSITNRGERTWLVRVFTPEANGKRTSHNKTIHGTEDDARRYLNGFLRDRDLGYTLSPMRAWVRC